MVGGGRRIGSSGSSLEEFEADLGYVRTYLRKTKHQKEKKKEDQEEINAPKQLHRMKKKMEKSSKNF